MGVAAAKGLSPRVIGVDDELAWAEIDIVFNDKSGLEILFGVWGSNLALGNGNLCLLLGFQDLVELLTALF